jgi:protein gp37
MVSPGCTNCYAMRQAHRFNGPSQPYEELTRAAEHGPVWTGKIRLVPDALDEPLRWRKPQRVFVNSMSDLFHEDVSEDFLNQIFAIMALAKEHTFQLLTKRPERMRDYLLEIQDDDLNRWASCAPEAYPCSPAAIENREWPLDNLWLGVSVENQAAADERIPILLQTPAAVRFLSIEPLLEAVHCQWEQLTRTLRAGENMIDWVIIGGESGPDARPCNVAWIREIMRQCRAAGVPVFVKQLGSRPWQPFKWELKTGTSVEAQAITLKDHKGGDPAEWPKDLRVREFPR